MTQIHPSAVVHKDTVIDESVIIGPNCVIGQNSEIGSGSIVGANVVIGQDVKIGKNNQFFPTCSIGGKPQILGLKTDQKVGRLEIGDNNTFREQTTVHPSMYPEKVTKIGNSNLIMIGVHIGHDCTIEDNIVMSNYVQVSGHCHIQTGVWFSGMVLLHQFVTVGKWVYASGLAGINHDVPPFVIVSGHYPPRVRGINKRGLTRAGLSQVQQQNVIDAYKKLYRKKGALIENAKQLAKSEGLDENVKLMVDIILNSNSHRFGRYLETFRH